MMLEKVEAALEEIRAMLGSHGGGIDLVGVDEDTGEVKVVLRGACAGCPGARATLKNIVESRLKEVVPDVKQVVAVS